MRGIKKALESVGRKLPVNDTDAPLAESGESSGGADYEIFLASGGPDFPWRLPEDEWESLSLLYTSGTTGDPKGVVYHHRGAYLNAIGNMQVWGMGPHPVYLWTLQIGRASCRERVCQSV